MSSQDPGPTQRLSSVASLRERLQRAARGERQIVLITGERGIGKATLIDEFQQQAMREVPGLRWAQGQSDEGYGSTEPYYPVLEAIRPLCRGDDREAVVATLAAQAPTWLVQFPALVTPQQRDLLQREILGATRERMLREICDALDTLASQQPLLLVLDDLHWADPSTIALLSAVARRRSSATLMVIGTYRTVDLRASSSPLNALSQDLLVHRLCQEISLEPLNEGDVEQYLSVASSSYAPAGLGALIHRHSDGNPLFMVAALDT